MLNIFCEEQTNMIQRKAQCNDPLEIDVAELAKYFPEFRYIPPFKSDLFNLSDMQELFMDLPKEFTSACASASIVNDNSTTHTEVLCFHDKNAKGLYGSISTSYSPAQLAFLLKRLPTELLELFKKALKNTSLEIPHLTEQEIKKLEEANEIQRQREVKLRSLQCRLKNTRSIDFAPAQTVTVLQHEYAISNAQSEQPILGTYGAGPCVILALYDKQDRVAILAHIDSMTDTQSISKLFSLISKNETVAHLAGGDRSHESVSMCIEIVDVLEKNNIKIENADLARSEFNSASSLAIDARTGAIYSPVAYYQLAQTDDIEFRLKMTALHLQISALTQYHHTNSKKIMEPIRGKVVATTKQHC